MTGFPSVCLSLLFTGNVALCFLNNAFEAGIFLNKVRELDTENY